MRLILACCVLVTCLSQVHGARILAVLPLGSKSHFIYTNAVVSALAARGHHVTVISPFPAPKAGANTTYIEIHSSFQENMKKSWTFESFKAIVGMDSFIGFHAPVIWQLSYITCEEILAHKKTQELLTSKFDLVISEALFGQESLLVLGHLFKAPTINLNGFGTWCLINKVHGNDLQISSFPEIVSFPFSNKMNFIERFRNLISTVATLFVYYNVHIPKHQEIIQKVFKDPSIPHLNDMLTNISLTLANFHPTVGFPQPITPNIVPIGGMHISDTTTPLPKDIKEFLDRGKNAVIYFSLGSVVPVHLMPPELLQMFVKVFTKLPYRVLWKIEADSIPNLPDNVMIAKWLPQQSVLAHPNLVLFITHGGLLSQQEAFHAGIPVVGIPFFGDQPFNVRVYEELGVGVGLDFNSLSEETFSKAILSVAGKPSFSENAKKISALFHHRPMSASDTAVFWVEYVLRHGYAEHLRPVAATMPWYSLYLLDILAAILAVLLAVFFVLRKIFSFLFSCCRKDDSKTIVSRKKKVN